MFPVHIADTVGGRIPVFSANSFCVISCIARITFSLYRNGMLYPSYFYNTIILRMP